MISTITNRDDYTGNDSTAGYAYNYKIFDEDHLVVQAIDPDDSTNVQTLSINTDYTVDGVGDEDGGNITLVNSQQEWLSQPNGYLDTGWLLSIRRVINNDQPFDVANQDDFYPEDHENQYDKFAMVNQQLEDSINRSFKIPSELKPSTYTVELTPSANKFIGWNSAGNALENKTPESLALSGDGIVDTDDLGEGSTNLYHTPGRVDARIAAAVLNDLNNVTVPSPSTGDDLTFNGTIWVPTSGLTTKGDLQGFSTAKARIPVGTNTHSLVADSAQALGLKWADPRYQNVVSYSSTDTADITDDVLLLSGASFTITLPTPVGNKGKVIKLIHTGTSLSQVYTLGLTGGAEVYFNDVAKSNVDLHTSGQVLEIVSDNADWRVIQSYTTTLPQDFTPTTSFSTNATWTGKWWRDGVFMEGIIRGSFSGATDTANFSMTIPGSQTIRTSYLLDSATDGSSDILGNIKLFDTSAGVALETILGKLHYLSTTTLGAGALDDPSSVTHWLRLVGNTLPFTIASGDKILIDFKVPITDWVA